MPSQGGVPFCVVLCPRSILEWCLIGLNVLRKTHPLVITMPPKSWLSCIHGSPELCRITCPVRSRLSAYPNTRQTGSLAGTLFFLAERARCYTQLFRTILHNHTVPCYTNAPKPLSSFFLLQVVGRLCVGSRHGSEQLLGRPHLIGKSRRHCRRAPLPASSRPAVQWAGSIDS